MTVGIWDCHAHAASSDYLPKPFFKGWVETIESTLPRRPGAKEKARLEGLFDQTLLDRECAELARQAEAAGITKTALLIIDFGLAFDLPGWDIEAIHREHKALLDAHPGRFLAFAGVDPRRGRSGLELFHKAVHEWGFAGLKVYPPCGFSPSDEALFPYYDLCAQKGLPVLVHIGPTSSAMAFRFSQPMEIDEAARRFPKVNFILGHAGATLHEEAGLLAQYRPNLYLDMSSFQKLGGGTGLADLMRWHLARNLGRRLLFGTDWPIHRFFGSQKDWVDAFLGLGTAGVLNPEQLDNLLYRNAAGLFSLE